MKNNIVKKLDSIVEIKISGKNINNYIKRILIKNKINIYKIKYLNYKEVLIILKYKDYLNLLENKSIYQIKLIKKHGRLKLLERLKKDYILLLSILISIIIIYTLSKLILKIEVIHTSSDIRKLIYEELYNNSIKKYNFKKTYEELEEIENKILNDNKEKLEWIEIIETGTKYIVRVEERKINKEKEEYRTQNIITKKNCVLYQIDAISGEKIKKPNDYVKKGDIIISGNILLPDGNNKTTMAKGQVLGEVWYEVEVEYPYTYYEERLTGNKKKVYVLNFLNHKISLFQFHPYKSFNRKTKVLVSNNIIDFKLSKETQYELKIISNIYTPEEAKHKAIELGKTKILKDNKDIKKIKDIIILKETETPKSIKIKLFIKTIEDVSEVQIIKDNKE